MEYAICEIIGSGTSRHPYRPVVAEYECDFVSIQKGNRYFVKFENGNITDALSDPRVVAFNRPLTDVLTALQASIINSRLEQRFGIISDPVQAGMTVRQALNAIALLIDDTFGWSNLALHGDTE